VVQSVVIDCFPGSVQRYREEHAIVAIDVIRATTTAVTAVWLGRRCLPVESLAAALQTATRLTNPLLVGEIGGKMPQGFDLTNSPAQLALRSDISRPAILLSTSGTQLICAAAAGCQAVYLACFRNCASLSRYLLGRHSRIAVIGAGSRNEFREEDQMCCAFITEELINGGYEPENQETLEIVERWSGALPSACTQGKSAAYLRSSGQLNDLEFVLSHINDVNAVFKLDGDEIVMLQEDPQFAVAGVGRSKMTDNDSTCAVPQGPA
jgi:2-phosphosulfolactate phosphatase